MLTSEYLLTSKRNWKIWGNRRFRYKLIAWFCITVGILAFLPFFFQYIEHRKGKSIQDPLLGLLKPVDFSIPIFIIIWSNAFMILLSFIRDGRILLRFMASYSLVTMLRLVLIYCIPLEPPNGLIPLKDPLSNSFYGSTFITKDLFFSGHTSTLFLIFLCLENKKTRLFSVVGTCIVAFLLLFQHVHYTIDIIFAFPFAFLCYLVAKKITER